MLQIKQVCCFNIHTHVNVVIGKVLLEEIQRIFFFTPQAALSIALLITLFFQSFASLQAQFHSDRYTL